MPENKVWNPDTRAYDTTTYKKKNARRRKPRKKARKSPRQGTSFTPLESLMMGAHKG